MLTTQSLLASVLTKLVKSGWWVTPKLKLKLDDSSLETGNAHLSGKFRGDAGEASCGLALTRKTAFVAKAWPSCAHQSVWMNEDVSSSLLKSLSLSLSLSASHALAYILDVPQCSDLNNGIGVEIYINTFYGDTRKNSRCLLRLHSSQASATQCGSGDAKSPTPTPTSVIMPDIHNQVY